MSSPFLLEKIADRRKSFNNMIILYDGAVRHFVIQELDPYTGDNKPAASNFYEETCSCFEAERVVYIVSWPFGSFFFHGHAEIMHGQLGAEPIHRDLG